MSSQVTSLLGGNSIKSLAFIKKLKECQKSNCMTLTARSYSYLCPSISTGFELLPFDDSFLYPYTSFNTAGTHLLNKVQTKRIDFDTPVIIDRLSMNDWYIFVNSQSTSGYAWSGQYITYDVEYKMTVDDEVVVDFIKSETVQNEQGRSVFMPQSVLDFVFSKHYNDTPYPAATINQFVLVEKSIEIYMKCNVSVYHPNASGSGYFSIPYVPKLICAGAFEL